MKRILIVDDDDAMRNLCRARLESDYEIVDTGNPERAVLMALQHKPDIVLMDLSMPKLSGFELCRTLSALSFAQQMSVFIVSGEDVRNKAFCEKLGASGYFEKPIDFKKLKTALLGATPAKRPELRAQPRVQLKILLKLKGKDKDSKDFEIRAATENISAGGFLGTCNGPLELNATVEVFLSSGDEHYLGRVRAIRTEGSDPQHPCFGFQFVETADWGEPTSSREASS